MDHCLLEIYGQEIYDEFTDELRDLMGKDYLWSQDHIQVELDYYWETFIDNYDCEGLSKKKQRQLKRSMKKRWYAQAREKWIKDNSARIIQRYYRKAIATPYYRMCRNRLMREFTNLSA